VAAHPRYLSLLMLLLLLVLDYGRQMSWSAVACSSAKARQLSPGC
jgi:hypothetical protein